MCYNEHIMKKWKFIADIKRALRRGEITPWKAAFLLERVIGDTRVHALSSVLLWITRKEKPGN